jgi:GntR family transcriptional regulator, rspAB operon transcriptional repressor
MVAQEISLDESAFLAESFNFDRSGSATRQVYEHLRNSIVCLKLRPGMVMPRTEVARKYGVSITPVRDALDRLEHEGLVEIYPYKEARVSRINLNTVRAALFLQQRLEPAILHALTDASCKTLSSLLLRNLTFQRHAVATRNVEEVLRYRWHFQRELFVQGRVEPLWDLVRKSSGDLDRLMRATWRFDEEPLSAFHEYSVIAAHLMERDRAAAAAVVQEQLRRDLMALELLQKTIKSDTLPQNFTFSALASCNVKSAECRDVQAVPCRRKT